MIYEKKASIVTGTLPVIMIEADTLPEAWERAVVETWEKGVPIATQYDQPGDPPSRDALAVIVVRDPFAEPRLHRAFPCGITELEAYRQEVVDGIHDHWIENGKWTHTYHQRLFDYPTCRETTPKIPTVVFRSFNHARMDQITAVIGTLVEAPHTRRAQAITWVPREDVLTEDPPCLQRMWFRIFGDELVMNINIRSNDGFKAAFMNMYAFTDLQRVIAGRVSERLGQPIRVGQYTHIADSFHIYGSYFQEFAGFLASLEKRTFEQRTFRTTDVQELIDEARVQITRSLEEEQRTGRKGL